MKIKSLFLMLALGALSASNIASAATVTFVGLYDGNDGTYGDGSDWLSDIINENLSEGTRLDWDFSDTDGDPLNGVTVPLNPQSSGGLTITGTTFKVGPPEEDAAEVTAADWTYMSSTTGIDYLTFKFDGFFALYSITDYNLGDTIGGNWDTETSWTNENVWETDQVGGVWTSTGNVVGIYGDTYKNGKTNFALSHGAGYEVVPIPAAVWLFGSGLLGLVGVARRRSA